MSANPFRRLLFLFGCPLYHCTFCRFQFRDWRRIQSGGIGSQARAAGA